MEPAELQVYMAIISIPWSLKFLYQIMSEMFDQNMQVQKGYLIVVNSIINVISMMLVIGFGLKQQASKAFITIMIFISQINMAYCDSVTDMYLAQIRETMFAQANDIEGRSDKSMLSRQRIMTKIQQEVDEKDRRLRLVTLIANSVGGVVGSLLSSAIHFMDGAQLMKQYTSPEICFGIYSGMQILMFISGACLIPPKSAN